MQNKGFIKFIAIALALACAYQLSFSVVSGVVEKKAAKYAAEQVAATTIDAAAIEKSGLSEDAYIENLLLKKEQQYLDSVKSKPVYNILIKKFTYKEVKEKEINLGLDLKGGMNVMLEIAVEDVVKALSNDSTDPTFLAAIEQAKVEAKNSQSDYITLFAKAYDKLSNGAPLAIIFNNQVMKDKVTLNSTNDEVVKVLREESESAIANSYNVLRSRIDRFGVAQPNIQRLENTGRILVELPGVKEPERVRKLLQGTASLEFWATYDNSEVFPMLQRANNVLRDMNVANVEEAEEEKTEAAEGDLLAELEGAEAQNAEAEFAAYAKNNPLFAKLMPATNAAGQVMRGPVVGHAMSYDMEAIEEYLALPQVKAVINPDVRFLWSSKAIDEAGTIYELYAIKADGRDGKAPLDGGSIVDASPQYSQTGGSAEVDMVMNTSGANVWARLTKANIGKSIAIVLDDVVYSAPTVQNEITGGRSQITGDFDITEATDLANVLKSGKLPAPARIIQDTVVGPSLGAESINASLISFVIAFVLVLLYMIFFYKGAGVVASIALICNVFFLFGVLASFGAVLTLPGIAGLVLTLGMAVDANVIIYERVKEELKAGKGLSLAVSEGYKNAMSAIVDANITTIITGIVLFVFGTGPVQGFATTLIIGIITSLFTSLFFTRIMFEGRLAKGKSISFSNKMTENFLANTKVNFIGIRKYSYIVSLVLIVASVISLSTRGLNYGVDFSGGRTFVVRFDQPVTADQVREGLQVVFDAAEGDVNSKSFEVKQFGDDTQMRIVTQYLYDEQNDEATATVEELLYNGVNGLFAEPISLEEFTSTTTNPNGIIQADMVGPSVASDITRGAFIAVFFALIAIGLYIIIRFKKWQWGAGSVVALAHDSFLTLGIFSLLHGLLPFNLEIDQSFIAAILTIIGYSINDKVVIFDRIREFTTLYPKRNLKETINAAVNTTLSRTINTTGTTFVTLLAIFLFGGAVIRGFVFALMFGVIIGTLSSIFIATPIAYDLMNKAAKKEAKKAAK
ncbi:MAG: protein translocase subunit SecDF [Tidjanibacter sp.]|nr:protein translocase subunit SecDF [Tidjanibacter sp.]